MVEILISFWDLAYFQLRLLLVSGRVQKKSLGKLQNSPSKTDVNYHTMSNVQNPVDIPLYWLFNRDPHIMAYEIIPT